VLNGFSLGLRRNYNPALWWVGTIAEFRVWLADMEQGAGQSARYYDSKVGMEIYNQILSRSMRFGLIILAGMLQGACSYQIYTSEEHRAFNLTADDLFEKGIAFTTPTSITGREQDRQSLALTFAEVLREKRPDIHVVSLPETLSAINRAGLLDEYMQMYENYEQTGIFDYSSLKNISAITGTRYIAQLNLSGFDQGDKGRFGIFGLRVLETKRANLRVFLQIWDTQEGMIAWEGYEEMNYSTETYTERGITFYDIARQIAENMVARIPHRTEDEDNESAQAASQSSEETARPSTN